MEDDQTIMFTFTLAKDFERTFHFISFRLVAGMFVRRLIRIIDGVECVHRT